jgi:hypothetical protein
MKRNELIKEVNKHAWFDLIMKKTMMMMMMMMMMYTDGRTEGGH